MEAQTTRLRYVNSSDPKLIEAFFDNLGRRVQIYEIFYAKSKFWVFFVPGDLSQDIKSVELD